MTRRFRAFGVLTKAGRARLAAVLVLSLASGSVSALPAWALGTLVTRLTTPGGSITPAVAILVALTAASGLIAHLTALTSIDLTGRLTAQMSRQVGERLVDHVSVEHLLRAGDQEQAARARSASRLAPHTLLDAVVSSVGVVAAAVTYVGILLQTWPWMSVLLLSTSVPLAVLQRRAVRFTLHQSLAAERSERWAEYYVELCANPEAGREVRVHGGSGFLKRLLTDELERARRMRLRILAADATVQMLFVCANAIVIGIGAGAAAAAVHSGDTSVGEFVLFTTAVTILQAKLATTLQMSSQVANALMLVEDYQAVVAERSNDNAGVAPRDVGQLRFEDVWFRYSPDAPWVLRGVNLTVDAGERVAIIGVNGSGKSTLAALALRLLEPTRGRVTWAGADIRDLDVERYRRLTTAVFQDFVQFEMTVAENVLLRHSTTDDEPLLNHYANCLGLGEALDRLPAKWDSLLSTQRRFSDSDVGVDLSGGQKQRLAILRAMSKDSAKLVVLDEPTAALDVRAERQAITTVEQRFPEASMLVITHRLAPAQLAGRVLTLEEGLLREAWSGLGRQFTATDYEEVSGSWKR